MVIGNENAALIHVWQHIDWLLPNFSVFLFIWTVFLSLLWCHPAVTASFLFSFNCILPVFTLLLNPQFSLNKFQALCKLTTFMLITPSFSLSHQSFKSIFLTISWIFSSEYCIDPLNSAGPSWTHFTSQNLFHLFSLGYWHASYPVA